MSPRAELFRVTPDDPEYLRLAQAEADFWAKPHPFGFERFEKTWQFNSPVDCHTNARFTGNPNLPWQGAVSRYGDFHRGLVLGTTLLTVETTLLETNPRLHLTFIDLSPGALERREQVLGKRFPGRVDTMLADLNFVDLGHQCYDCIISAATLHHVVNLESLAHEINAALAPGGYFFLQDYVGEPRSQFSEKKRRAFEALYAREAALNPGRKPEVCWKDASDLSPFCGVRSDATLGVMRDQLEEISVRTAGTLTYMVMRSLPVDGQWPRPQTMANRASERLGELLCKLRGALPPNKLPLTRRFADQLMLVEDVLADAGLVTPAVAFAIYRKR
jgi:SAM-dependent methyltransferase